MVSTQQVVEPISLLIFAESIIIYLGLLIYLSIFLCHNYVIIFANYFEYLAGSTPCSAHPPTPSITDNIYSSANIASSPPLYSFSG